MPKEKDPFITFLMCSRKKNNPDSHLLSFLESAKKFISNQEIENVELLVKFDMDDDETYKQILNTNWDEKRHNQPNLIKHYNLPTRWFIYNRGEGRNSLHNDYMFLFSQRNPKTKFVMFVTDDCVFERKCIVEDLRKLKNYDWCILGDKIPKVEYYENYRKDQSWRLDVSAFPIISTNLLHIAQNIGWQVNLDNWLTLLHTILVHKYKLNLWHLTPLYVRRIGGRSRQTDYKETYNPLQIDNKRQCNNPYYFDLVEQQAKNIYLNYIHRKLHDIADNIKKNVRK